MKDINKRVGLNIRRTRENAGLSQEKLAALADLHRAYIGQKTTWRSRTNLITLYC